MTDNKNIEDITKSAYRAVSGDAHGDVVFGGAQTSLTSGDKRFIKKNKKTTVRLPSPEQSKPIEKQTHLRGSSDSAALYLKYHDEKIGISGLNSVEGQELFNVLEQARCEALGARHLKGVANNIISAIEKSCKQKGYDKDGIEISHEDSLYTLAFEALSGHRLDNVATHTADQYRIIIEEKLGSNAFSTLTDSLSDQAEFAKLSENFIRRMMGLEMPDSNGENGGEATDVDHQSIGDEGTDSDENGDNQGTEQELQQSQSSTDNLSENTEGDQQKTLMGADDDELIDGEDGGDSAQNNTHGSDPFYDRDINYSVYTSEFDEVIEPSKLATADELRQLREKLDDQLQPLQALIGKLANRLQRILMAKKQRQWRFDEEEGILNTARLARLIIDPDLPVTYKREIETDFKDTVLTLLIDNSGSMRGRPITIAALSADILARTLERTGVKVEILGFTTAAWKGGKSREQWTKNQRPPMPGRLNDLRHIIYKSADAPLRRARNNLGLMLKEGVLKENIDGEALLWAYKRLKNRSEDRKILMVISDGAPVDDSTLSANKSGYLESDLHNIIHVIQKQKNVELSAIGIGHDVSKYYNNAITIRDAKDLPIVMMNELALLFDAG